MVVWSNLIWKQCTAYPDLTYKQLYLTLYGVKGTKAERALQRMDTMEIKEREERRLRTESSSTDEEGNEADDADVHNHRPTNYGPRIVFPDVISEEEAECRKYVYVGEAVDSQADLQSMRSPQNNHDLLKNGDPSPARPARPSKELYPISSLEMRELDNASQPSGNAYRTSVNRIDSKDTVPVRPPPQRSDSEEFKRSALNRVLEMLPFSSKAKNNEKKSMSNVDGEFS